MKSIFLATLMLLCQVSYAKKTADLIIVNGKIATMVKPGDFIRLLQSRTGLFWQPVIQKLFFQSTTGQKEQVPDRFTAMRIYTSGSAWFTGEEKLKGQIVKGMYGDISILSADYFSILTDDIRNLESLLTSVNGKIVYAAGEYRPLDIPAPAVIPEWSPVKYYGGYQN